METTYRFGIGERLAVVGIIIGVGSSVVGLMFPLAYPDAFDLSAARRVVWSGAVVFGLSLLFFFCDVARYFIVRKGAKLGTALVIIGVFLIAVGAIVGGIGAMKLDSASSTAETEAKKEKKSAVSPDGSSGRAYVFVTDGFVETPAGGTPTVAVNIKNTGQTPAVDLTWRAKFEVHLIGDERKIALEPDAIGVKQVLPPGESLSYKYTFPAWDSKIDALLAAETAAIFAVGEIRYRDNAGISRFTDYLLKSGGRFEIKTGIGPGRFGAVDVKSN